MRERTARWIGAGLLLAAIAFGSAARIHTALSLPGFDATRAEGMLKSDPALLYYYRKDLVARVTSVLRPFYRLLWNKYYIDELYDRAIVQPLVRISDVVLYRIVDARMIDGLVVNGAAGFVRGIADRGLKLVQTGFVQSYMFVMLVGGVLLAAYMLRGT